jgi:DNA-binding transcriptional ArsR family regulator
VTGQDLPRSVRLSDPRALRGYAHPTRMALVALLRREGAQTATQAAKAIGESVASCSFHLRQLAKYGLVEEADLRGREKPWRATAMFTDFEVDAGSGGTGTGNAGSDSAGSDSVGPGGAGDLAAAAAGQALALAIVGQYVEVMTRWVRASSGEPAEWREAAQLGDTMLHLTAAELRDLGDKMQRLLEPYLERLGDPVQHPPDARPVVVLNMAFPILTNTEEER